MLKQRLISAALMLLIFIGCFFLLPNIFFEILVMLISATLFYELRTLLNIYGRQSLFYWLFSLASLVPFFAYNDDLKAFGVFFALLACLFWLVLVPFKMQMGLRQPSFLKHSYFLYGFILITPMFYSVLILFNENKSFLLFVFIVVWIADIAAYFTGKRFGSIQIASHISPGKTLEGVLGGIVFNIIFVILIKLNFDQFDLLSGLIFCIFISALSVYGDLFESLLKRLAGVKDSNNIIPGHGGFLDRVDGFLPSLPFAFIYFQYASLTV
ncbi:phosphatidate cytidylyltransferase [Methylophilaceae bacterium]|nr:phosphatidate cytidylyltransferase [Methylophilaceae bacterium]MDC0128412.1 phosphatidate cytidylyltransferase [Methylophilaceae bacterium]